MNRIQWPCKFCGLPATAEFEDWAPQEAVDKWLPALAHNRCADMRAALRDSGDAIVHACFLMDRSKLPTQEIEKLRTVLMYQTRKYATAVSDINNRKTVIWHESFVDLLMDKPDMVGQILHDYRQKI